MEGRVGDAKKTRRPAAPSPSASQISMETYQVDAGPSNALNANPGRASQYVGGAEGASGRGEEDTRGVDEGTELEGDEESLPVAWEQEISNYRKRMERPLAAPPNAQRLAELTKEHRLGGAYIHAFGIGHLLSVVNMGEDPNLRGNPRDLNSSHVDNLFGVFSVPGCLRDHESPIYLMVPRKLVSAELLVAMSKANPHDPTSEMPRLTLKHDHTEEMVRLEEQLLSQVKDGKWMSEQDLKANEERLVALRAKAPLATLLNGQHRIHAMMRLGDLTREDHTELLRKVRNESISPELMRAEVAEIRERAKMTVYRVEVFDSEMPDELFNYLVRNEDIRPQMGMGAGEKAWWTASRWEILIRNAENEGAQSRAAAADKAFSEWCKEIGVKIDRAVAGAQSLASNKGSRGAHSKGEWAGHDAVSRLFTDPCTMELVVDTRSAMTVYENVLQRTTAVAMLQSTGALVVGRFWLACRTFLQIFNVAKGPGLQAAEQFLESHPSITVDGDPDAVIPWNDLHSHPQNTPEYMGFYTADLQNEFDELYETVLNGHNRAIDIDWKADETGRQVRQVFDTLGKRLQGRGPEWCRKVGACMRLYARLPMTAVDGSLQGPQFCPTSALPAKRWLKRVANDNQHFALKGDGLVILEFMIDRFLPIWTIGAQSVGTSVNSHNWYGRSRGLHQILMRLVQADRFGTMDARLNLGNVLLSDPQMRLALQAVDKSLGDRFRTLMRQHCVLRSHPFDFPFVESIAPAELEKCGGRRELIAEIGEGRTALKGLVFRTPHPTVEQYHDLLEMPCPELFKRIPRDFWSDFDPASWVRGWNTSSAKQFRDVNSIIGWGLLMPYVSGLLQQVFDSQDALHLISTMLWLSSVTGRKSWWAGIDLFERTRSAVRHDDDRNERAIPELETQEESLGDAGQSQMDIHRRAASEGENSAGHEGHKDDTTRRDGGELRNEAETQSSDMEDRPDAGSGAPRAPKACAPNTLSKRRENTRTSTVSAAKSLGQSQRPLRKELQTRTSRGERQSASSAPTTIEPDILVPPNTSPAPQSPAQGSDSGQSRGPDAAGGESTPSSVLPTQTPAGTDLRDGKPAWQRALRLNPPYLMTPPVAPSKTLDFLLGCGLFERPADPDALARAIELNARNLENVVLRINSERQKLRQSVSMAAKHCVDAEYGGYFAQTGLAAMMACYKDIFVACVSRILREELQMAEPEAVNEAMAMAVSDDLYITDVARFNNANGELAVDLAQTFARGHQDQLRDDEIVQVGSVNGNREDRDQVLGLMQWFHPVRGIGRTENESAIRGMDGALMQLTGRRAKQRNTPVYLSILSRPELLPISGGSRVTDDLPLIGDVQKKWGIEEWTAPTQQMTQQPELSSLSTGQFTDPQRGLELLRPDMREHGIRALAVAEEATGHWHDAQYTDNVVYQLWLKEPLHNPAGPPTESTTGTGCQPAAAVPAVSARAIVFVSN